MAKTNGFNVIAFMTGLAPWVLLSNAAYFTFRLWTLLGGNTLPATLFLLMELGFHVPDIARQILLTAARGKLRERLWRRLQIGARQADPKPLLMPTGVPCTLVRKAPTVDVFITCAGEELDVILDTVLAARATDYPPDAFRVFVLDDVNSPALAQSLAKLEKSNLPEVHHVTRPPHEPPSKAANTNRGLMHSKNLPSGPSEFVALLDVDMICEPCWLQALVPHLVEDPTLGLAQSPQRFYNVVNGDVIGHGDLNKDFLQVIKDSIDSADCMATGYVCRRKAIDQIGGFPCQSTQDDFFTALELNCKGWKIAYVHEDLQYGLLPSTYQKHVQREARLTSGFADYILEMWDPRKKNLTWLRRYGRTVWQFNQSLAAVPLLSSCLLLAIVLWSGASVVRASNSYWLHVQLTLTFFHRMLNAYFNFLMATSAGLRVPMHARETELWMAPYRVRGLIHLAQRILCGRRKGAAYTPCGLPSKIRDPSVLPLFQRLKYVLWESSAYHHAVYLAAVLAGGALYVARGFSNATSQPSTCSSALQLAFSSFLYPPLVEAFVDCVCQAQVPILHAIYMKPVPERQTLLQRDSKGVAYPTAQAKDIYRTKPMFGPRGRDKYILAYYAITLLVSSLLF